MNPDKEVEDWVYEAEQDFGLAEGAIELGYYARSTGISEQAAEKAVKALYLAVNRALAPRTHKIDDIAQTLGAPPELVLGASTLVGDYFASRYPGAAHGRPSDAYSKEMAVERLEIARSIVQWVKSRLEAS